MKLHSPTRHFFHFDVYVYWSRHWSAWQRTVHSATPSTSSLPGTWPVRAHPFHFFY